jgi:rod shape-determining protein MreC
MRNIPIRWIETAIFSLIVIGLLVLSLGGYLSPFVSSSLKPFVAAGTWVSTRYNAVHDFLTVPRDVASLRQRNVDLEAEVARLQTQVIELQQQISEAQVLYALLDFARAHPENQYIASSVIGKDPSPFLHYVIINQGSDDGVRHGMPVVNQKGLIGRVDAVTASASRVQLISDTGASVNVRLESSPVEIIMQGSVTGELSLQMVPQDLNIKAGDVLLTSGLGGGYPGNLMIGQVANVQQMGSNLFKSATVQPIVDLSSLDVVLVISNFKPVDITPLVPTPGS